MILLFVTSQDNRTNETNRALSEMPSLEQRVYHLNTLKDAEIPSILHNQHASLKTELTDCKALVAKLQER